MRGEISQVSLFRPHTNSNEKIYGESNNSYFYDMETVDIKAELQALIEKETDKSILEAIMTLLRKSSLDPALKQKLTARALKAEDDITAGRVMDRHELEKRLSSKVTK